MLIIRLSRHGRTKRPFYRLVLTEHTKPAKYGYKKVLWSYDPFTHKLEAQIDEIKSYIEQWSQLSERVAKLLFKETNDKLFEKFFTHKTKTRKPKKEETENK